MVEKKLSCVLKITGGVTAKVLEHTDVLIFADGEPIRYEYKSGGYFVLTDMPEGAHSLKVQSYGFQQEELEINIDYRMIKRAEQTVINLALSPSPLHPSAFGMPSVSGRAKGFRELYVQRHSMELKIAEDNAAAGSNKIRLFCRSTKPTLPSFALIGDRLGETCEIVILKTAAGDAYMTDKPLRYDHQRSEHVVPLMRLRCDEDGTFYLLLTPDLTSEREKDLIPLIFLAEKDGMICSTLSMAMPEGKTELGEPDFI